MLTPSDFKASLALFASGVTVITWDDSDGIQGITVSAFSSLSLEPPLVLFCIDKNAYVNQAMREKSHFIVNMLAGEQTDLAWRFAGADRSDLDAHIERNNAQNLPALKGALCQLVVEVRDILPGGDHDIFIAEVQESLRYPERAPLLYHNSRMFSA